VTTETDEKPIPPLFEADDLPDDPTAEPAPGDFFAAHFWVARGDQGIKIAVDNHMPLGAVVNALRLLADRLELGAEGDVIIRNLAAEGAEAYEADVASGADPGVAQLKAIVGIVAGTRKAGAEKAASCKDEKNENGDAPPTE
jgi:hypothetical protein